ncbi:MAG: beta-ketoacyl synthase chain length factor [Fulvivirga sp.]
MKVYITGSSAITPQHTFNAESYLEHWVEHEQQYQQAMEPDYRNYIDPKQSRRMSRVIKMSVASAIKAMARAGVDQPDAIIVGTGLGCITDTEKFLLNIIQEDEGVLSPTAFIQSTHNTIAGQLALLLQCPNHNLTYANRGHSFENALVDATLYLQEGAAHVLTGGVDEMTPTVFDIMQKMGYAGVAGQPKWGEGAAFFVLSAQKSHNAVCLEDFHLFNNPVAEELDLMLSRFLAKNEVDADQIDALIIGQQDAQDLFYARVLNHFTGIPVVNFKDITGEYFTASAFAYDLAKVMLQQQQVFKNELQPDNCKYSLGKVLIYNHYNGVNHSLALLSI